MRLVLTALYVPGDRPERVAKALDSEADVVIVDLEDAVAPACKAAARAGLAQLLADVARPVQVRVNALGSPWYDGDVEALAGIDGVGLRVPKARDPERLAGLAAALPGRDLHLLVESADGLERAFDLARLPQVATIGLGEADLRSQLRVSGDTGLAWARSRIVVAARAAGLPSPMMAVYPRLDDPAGLVASCRAGRALGLIGRAAIHPSQLEPIREGFRPEPAEVEHATAVLERVAEAEAVGEATVVLPDGSFLDAAMVEEAEVVLALADLT